MTQDDIIRLAREAGLDADWIEDCDGELTALQRFASLASSAARDAGRLEGWQAAREQAAEMCGEEADGWDVVRHKGLTSIHRIANDEARKCAAIIRAMQPPAEWGDIGKSVSESQESLCKTCARANVSCPVYPLETQHCVEHVSACGAAPNDVSKLAAENDTSARHVDGSDAWFHPDGFGGGLTERTENGQDQEGQSQP